MKFLQPEYKGQHLSVTAIKWIWVKEILSLLLQADTISIVNLRKVEKTGSRLRLAEMT